MNLRKADILLISSPSLISKFISWGEEIAEKDSFEPSHVALIENERYIWESTIGGVQRSKLKKYLKPRNIVFCASCLFLTDEDRDKIIAEAKLLAGRGYGYLDLVVYLGDIFLEKLGFDRNTLTRKLNRADRLVCSELVARCYARGARVLFRGDRNEWLPPSTVRPDDIWRTAITSEEWRVEVLT